MIETLSVLALIWIALSAIYLLKNKKPTQHKEGKYIWIGPGEDPFKK